MGGGTPPTGRGGRARGRRSRRARAKERGAQNKRVAAPAPPPSHSFALACVNEPGARRHTGRRWGPCWCVLVGGGKGGTSWKESRETGSEQEPRASAWPCSFFCSAYFCFPSLFFSLSLMRSLIVAAAAAVATLAAGVAAEPALMERFSSLDAWKHSSDEKYTGAFEVAGGALTVRLVGRMCAGWGLAWRPGVARAWLEGGLGCGSGRGRGRKRGSLAFFQWAGDLPASAPPFFHAPAGRLPPLPAGRHRHPDLCQPHCTASQP